YPVEARGRPALRWKQDVCVTRELGPKEARVRHHLLTLAGPYVVYCSHSGAIVALDAETGRRAWAVRYPSRGPTIDSVQPSPRALARCVQADGGVYAAPADCDRLLCLDAATGRVLWEKQSVEVVHLLGVGHGRLIFTARDGLRAIGALTGADAGGWVFPPAGR